MPTFGVTRELVELVFRSRTGPIALDLMNMSDLADSFIDTSVARATYLFAGLDAKKDGARINRLAAGHAVTVVTLGASGVRAFACGEVFEVGAIPVCPVVDTTGCGDAFAGAFLAAVDRGASVPEALREGRILAGRRATRRGAC